MPLNSVGPGWTRRRTRMLACSLEDRGSDIAGVHLAGQLCAATAPELARTLNRAERQARLVLLDLRELTFIDACGLHAIVAAGIRARRAGGRLVAVRKPGTVDPVFALRAATTVVDIVDLHPGQPAVQALLTLAQRDRAA